MDVAKVDRDVAYVASVSEACCKRLFKMFHLFSDVCCKRFYLDVAYVSHTYVVRVWFKMFQLFQSYVAISVFMLQVVIWILHMFHIYVASICSKYFIHFRRTLHPSVSCFPGKSHGGMARGVRGWGALGPAVGTCSAPRVLRMGRTRPHASLGPLVRRERMGLGECAGAAGAAFPASASIQNRGEKGGARGKERQEQCFFREHA
jgi:hypothetical protein